MSLKGNLSETKHYTLLETGLPFYVFICATRRTSHLDSKGSIPSFLSYFKTLGTSMALGNEPATSGSVGLQVLYRLSLS